MNNDALIEELNKTIIEKDDLIQKLKKELEYKDRILGLAAEVIKTGLEKQ